MDNIGEPRIEIIESNDTSHKNLEGSSSSKRN